MLNTTPFKKYNPDRPTVDLNNCGSLKAVIDTLVAEHSKDPNVYGFGQLGLKEPTALRSTLGAPSSTNYIVCNIRVLDRGWYDGFYKDALLQATAFENYGGAMWTKLIHSNNTGGYYQTNWKQQ